MKRILIAILALVLTISFVSCNAKSVDISNASAIDIATSVNETLTFVDYMLELDDSIATNFYALPDGVVEMKVYVSSSGATAEELAVFKCKDEETTEAVIKSCEKRIETLKEKYEDYIPAEMDKIENAVIKKRDCFVMFVCANDTAPAEECFKNYK